MNFNFERYPVQRDPANWKKNFGLSQTDVATGNSIVMYFKVEHCWIR